MEYSAQQILSTTQLKIATNLEISILLATLRPENTRKCIESIAETSEGIDYEVVVVSPLDMCNLLAGCKGYSRLKFVKEKKKDGCNKAYTTGYENAVGKYVFAIADDHRLGQDCLKNLIEFMRLHDQDLFLAGARCYGVYGAGPECKTYGFYYAFTPCIRKDLVEHIGGFYDPYYKSYYGDPDLSMRVWHKGGRVELCLDAWVEYHNELDDINFEAHTQYAKRDFLAFFQKWHPIYGHLAKSCSEKDINICNNYVLPGIPPEKCTRLVVFLRQKDWLSLGKELINEKNFPLTQDHLFYVFKEMMMYVSLAPINVIQNLSKWLIKQLLTQTSFKGNNIPEKFKSKISFKFNENPDPLNLFSAIIFMFYMTGGSKREQELIIENYHGINIIYSSRQFYTWPCSFGGFTIDIFEKTSDKFAFCTSRISHALRKIDNLKGVNCALNWQEAQNMEDSFASNNFEQLRNTYAHQNLPNEICFKAVLYLKLNDWDKIEPLLNETNEKVFIVRKHICYVYGEVLRNSNEIPINLALKLSQWLLEQLNAFES